MDQILTSALKQYFKEAKQDILNAKYLGALGLYSAFCEYIQKHAESFNKKTINEFANLCIYLKTTLDEYGKDFKVL